MTLRERQEALEAEMIQSGRERFEAQLQKAIAQGRLAETRPGLKILLRSREALAQGLASEQDRTGKMGPKATKTGRYLAGIPSEEVAHVALAAALGKLGSGQPASLQSVTAQMARHVEGYMQSSTWEKIGAPPLPDKDRQQIGLSLMGMLREATASLFHEQPQTENVTLLTLAPEVQAEIAAAPDLAPPIYLPCLIPPRPWLTLAEDGTGGGYHTPALRRRLSVMRVTRGPYLEDLSHVNLAVVLAALNTVQATGWTVNRPVYEAMRQEYGPPTLARVALLRVAERFLDDVFYFPHSLDWRGRLYPVPDVNIVSGGDAERGLFTFAVGKPIASQAAADWLAVHGANVYGVKGSLRERVQWIKDHEAKILARDCSGADEPWQFLAFCHEWAGYLRDGLSFVSSLPVGMDATCSVYQHLGALLRDEQIGSLVNLTPAEKPQDIYRTVGDAVGVSRKVVKAPVMTMVYGSARSTRHEQIRERLPDLQWKAIDTLVAQVDAALKTLTPRAFALLKWFRAVARATTKVSLPVLWTTPAGLPVSLREPEQESKVVTVVRHGVPLRSRFLQDVVPFKLDAAAQVSGLAPSFVHSLDASHLMLTVNAARKLGVTSFAMVHDCYGTVAADAPVLAEVLREQFVKMYEQHDPLRDLRDGLVALGVEVPALPERGTLDVSLVRKSDYFFS